MRLVTTKVLAVINIFGQLGDIFRPPIIRFYSQIEIFKQEFQADLKLQTDLVYSANIPASMQKNGMKQKKNSFPKYQHQFVSYFINKKSQ